MRETLIVADLEWNGAYSGQTHGYFNEIIEIGAVRLDKKLHIKDTFHAIIKPVVTRKLSHLVQDLTNITDAHLAGGGTFIEAMARLKKWAGKRACLLTWSNTDLLVWMENCRLNFGDAKIPFMSSWADAQSYVQTALQVPTSQQLGLAKACELTGVTTQGADMHRAVDDSVLAARVLQKVFDPATFTVQTADEAFYAHVQFHSMIIRDLNSPLIDKKELLFACPQCKRDMPHHSRWRFFQRAFHADFDCPVCGKRYHAHIQFRQKGEVVEVRRKLVEHKPFPERRPEHRPEYKAIGEQPAAPLSTEPVAHMHYV